MRTTFDPALLEAVRGQLARELVLRALLHDLRSGLTAALGWLELLSAGAHPPPAGLGNALQGLREVAERYGRLRWAAPPPPQPLSRYTEAAIGVPIVPDLPLPLDPLPLVAALDLLRPEALEARRDSSYHGRVVVLALPGLPGEIVRFASGPHRDEVLHAAFHPGRLLAGGLLREVVRPAGGEVRDDGRGRLELVLPLP